MSYEKQTWVTGETITAEKLNHIESGVAGSDPVIIHGDISTYSVDITLDDLNNIVENNINCYLVITDNTLWDYEITLQGTIRYHKSEENPNSHPEIIFPCMMYQDYYSDKPRNILRYYVISKYYDDIYLSYTDYGMNNFNPN